MENLTIQPTNYQKNKASREYSKRAKRREQRAKDLAGPITRTKISTGEPLEPTQ